MSRFVQRPAVGFLIALLAGAAMIDPARAESPCPPGESCLSSIFSAAVVPGVASISILIINAVNYGRSSNGMRYTGYILGGISVFMGSFMTVVGASGADRTLAPVWYGTGTAMVALGIGNILVSYLSGRRAGATLKLSPSVTRTVRGGLAPMVALRLADW